jgi:hypothetical protein
MLDNKEIMQFADGLLKGSEKDAVKKEIDNNPQYKKILNDYLYTGQLLSNLGNEIKSKPLPNLLSQKIKDFNKNKSYYSPKEKYSFNFFNIFNIKYSAITAAFCIVFISGFLTEQYLQIGQTNNQSSKNLAFSTNSKQITTSEHYEFRGSSENSNEFNFYESFNEKIFNNNINKQISNTKKDEKFEVLVSETQKLTFQFKESFKDKNGNECRIIKSTKRIRLTEKGSLNVITFTVCKKINGWNLESINFN